MQLPSDKRNSYVNNGTCNKRNNYVNIGTCNKGKIVLREKGEFRFFEGALITGEQNWNFGTSHGD